MTPASAPQAPHVAPNPGGGSGLKGWPAARLLTCECKSLVPVIKVGWTLSVGLLGRDDVVLTVKVTAEGLEVNEQPLRRRDNVGRPRLKRHPMNDSRVYARRHVPRSWRRTPSGSEKAS